MFENITITGSTLSTEDIRSLISDAGVKVSLLKANLTAAEKSRAFLDKTLGEKITYGVNTGFGPMASHIIGRKQLTELQYNLVRSHAVGIGSPIEPSYVLAAMVVRLNTMAKGYSGVSAKLLEQLAAFINHRVIPVIPEHGAVGTSGDLVQLAHIALALIGEGEVFYQDRRQPVAGVLKKLRLQPYKLRPKEGLSLINGTSCMAGIAAILCTQARQLMDTAVRSGAWALELNRSFDDGISEELHALRPHRGQTAVAKKLRAILASSKLMKQRKAFQEKFHIAKEVHEIPEDVQEIYSFRCVPQILGPIHDALAKTAKDVSVEINSVTDNPIIDWRKKAFLHGGNFHGDVIAVSVDQLKAGLAKLTLLSERRTNFFLNSKINRRFPPFLNMNKPGLTLALQGLQFVATSTAAQNQTLSFPHSVHSIPTNADNQDVVSMGSDAALMAMKVVENASVVMAIELITLAQATDLTKDHEQLSKSSNDLYRRLRAVFPAVDEDRNLTQELPKVVDLLKQLK